MVVATKPSHSTAARVSPSDSGVSQCGGVTDQARYSCLTNG